MKKLGGIPTGGADRLNQDQDMATAADRRIALGDGRGLGFAEFGDPAGRPVFYFHGFPGSRLEAGLAQDAAARSGVRLIGVDRPGYGLSDFKAGRAIRDWASDVTELAEGLGIERFAVLGVSGGGPYALSCAAGIPGRLTAAGVACGLGPVDMPGAAAGMQRLHRIGFFLARYAPPFARLVFSAATLGVSRNPGRLLARLDAALPEPDRSVLGRPVFRGIYGRSLAEAFRSGSRGPAWDVTLYRSPWGFSLEAIESSVYLWQGGRDVIVPPSMARMQADAIPGCSARYYPDEGHFSLVVNHVEQIFEVLASRDRDVPEFEAHVPLIPREESK
jgi:pimeloyl-ACP methyl ester carboxylesterase